MKRRKKTIILFLAASITAFYFSSCGPDDPKPHYTVSQETKDYCVFQDDTRWIYQEEGTSFMDTLLVYDYSYLKIEDDQAFYFDDFRYKCKSSKIGNVKKFRDFIVNPRMDLDPTKSWCWGGTPETRGLSPVEYFEASVIGEIIIRYANTEGIKYVAYHDSFEVRGKYYNDVKVFEHLTKMGEAFPQKIFWSKNIGRIRYELGNGEIWNLKEYSINQ